MRNVGSWSISEVEFTGEAYKKAILFEDPLNERRRL